MVTAAYAALGNDRWIAPHTSMWPYEDFRSAADELPAAQPEEGRVTKWAATART